MLPTSDDLLVLLNFLEMLLAFDNVPGIETIVLPGLAALLHSELAIYHHTAQLTSPVQIDIGWPGDSFVPQNLEAYSALAAEHPLVQHLGTVAPSELLLPCAVSELLTMTQWHNTAVYQEALRHLGGGDQI